VKFSDENNFGTKFATISIDFIDLIFAWANERPVNPGGMYSSGFRKRIFF
jgi:hypothetical protein